MNSVLIIEDERMAADNLREFLAGRGFAAACAYTRAEAERLADAKQYAAVLLDVRLPDGNGLELIPRLRRSSPEAVLMVITAYGAVADAVTALKSGADHYLLKPLDLDELLLVLTRELERQSLRAENLVLKTYVSSLSGFPNLIGSSPALAPVVERARKLVDSDATVLITGESGTGKGLMARTLHYAGRRQQERFVAVSCAAIPDQLLESELFGHVKGAFTGAAADHIGRFEYAARGTLFLDEIGELTPPMQAKLLRVLQERVYEKLGSNREERTDARVIASTNRDLSEMVKAGAFREDLYWRLNVVQLHLPPLRDRREDLDLLVKFFLEKYARAAARPVPTVAPDAAELFARYPWPGNVRELEHVIERAITLMEEPEVTVDLLPSRLREFESAGEGAAPGTPPGDSLRARVEQCEKQAIHDALQAAAGNRKQTAARLQISLRALQYKLKYYSLE